MLFPLLLQKVLDKITEICYWFYFLFEKVLIFYFFVVISQDVKLALFIGQEYTSSHTCYSEIQFAPYLLDLTPSVYILFPNLKKCLGGNIFTSNEEVGCANVVFFLNLDDSHFKLGVKAMEHRWEIFIELF